MYERSEKQSSQKTCCHWPVIIALTIAIALISVTIPQYRNSTDSVQSLSIDSTPDLKMMHRIDQLKGSKPIRILEQITPDCDQVGIFLGLSEGVVRTEWETVRDHPEKKCINIISKWLRGRGKPVSWRTFIQALRELEFNVLADELENLFRDVQH